ncbi:MAG: DUF2911 domain-containing protein [Bacteroidota bacterium]
MKKFVLLLSTLLLFTAGSLTAQDRAPSPAATVSQKVGLTDVTIEYSRPSMKDRTIFAKDGLVPFGKIWRTGANGATKITFSGPVTIGDTELEAGSYAILTKPGKDSWAVHFYPFKANSWGSYRDAKPVAMAEAKPSMGSNSVESFLITIDNLRDYSAHLVMMWDKTKVEVPFKVK